MTESLAALGSAYFRKEKDSGVGGRGGGGIEEGQEYPKKQSRSTPRRIVRGVAEACDRLLTSVGLPAPPPLSFS